jgi:hypothetical protein
MQLDDTYDGDRAIRLLQAKIEKAFPPELADAAFDRVTEIAAKL